MLLGGHVFPKTDDPRELAGLLAEKGYRAGYCPKALALSDAQTVRDLKRAFEKHRLVLAEW